MHPAVRHAACTHPVTLQSYIWLVGRYTTLSDAWRASGSRASSSRYSDRQASPQSGHTSCSAGGAKPYTGVGGGRWYRFQGAGGDALPLASPPVQCLAAHGTWLCPCGTSNGGWLGATHPDGSHSGAGRYPTAAEGVAEMVVCFGSRSGAVRRLPVMAAGGRTKLWHGLLYCAERAVVSGRGGLPRALCAVESLRV
jgi:hypothetical protein